MNEPHGIPSYRDLSFTSAHTHSDTYAYTGSYTNAESFATNDHDAAAWLYIGEHRDRRQVHGPVELEAKSW